MKHITFYFDFISPYAYLAFEKLPEVLMGQSYSISYKPVLFAALLKHHGQLGPAEIQSKREWTYRQSLWLARQQGTELLLPSKHPFNPIGLLRLAVACGARTNELKSTFDAPNRYVVETLFRHVWNTGGDAADATRVAALAAILSPVCEASCAEVKDQLRANTEEAIANNVFGVPTLLVDDKLFWGQDALPMVQDYLNRDAWFAGSGWQAVSQVEVGAVRPRGKG
jgi:2-hydroxychromene-2-carboxylate isomerase